MSILIFGIKKIKISFICISEWKTEIVLIVFIVITFILKMKLKYFKIESIEIRFWIFD